MRRWLAIPILFLSVWYLVIGVGLAFFGQTWGIDTAEIAFGLSAVWALVSYGNLKR